MTLNPLASLKVSFLILPPVSFFDPHFGYLVDWKLIYKTSPDSSKGVLVSLRRGSNIWICVHTPRVPLTLTLAFLPIPDGNFQLSVLGGLELAEGKTTVLNTGSAQPSGMMPYVSAVLFYEFFCNVWIIHDVIKTPPLTKLWRDSDNLRGTPSPCSPPLPLHHPPLREPVSKILAVKNIHGLPR